MQSLRNALFFAYWEMLLEKGLDILGKDRASIEGDLKSAQWKVLLAALLKRKTSATNAWITGQLNMGTADAVSRYVSEFRASGGDCQTNFVNLTTKVMKCPLFFVLPVSSSAGLSGKNVEGIQILTILNTSNETNGK